MRVGVAMVAFLLPLVCGAEKLKIEPAEEFGAVALSLRIEDHCPGPNSTAMVTFEGILKNGKTMRSLFPISVGEAPMVGFMMRDPLQNPPGRLVAQRLPVGNYRLIEFGRTYTGNKFRSANSLDIYFEVKPGTVSYLGELYFRIIDCKQFDVRVNDQQQRDAVLFDQQIEDIESTSFVRQLLSIPDALIGPQPNGGS